MGSEENGERVQYGIDDVHHGQRSILKGLSKTCQYQLLLQKIEEEALKNEAIRFYIQLKEHSLMSFDGRR